jgi:hypothetical protein
MFVASALRSLFPAPSSAPVFPQDFRLTLTASRTSALFSVPKTLDYLLNSFLFNRLRILDLLMLAPSRIKNPHNPRPFNRLHTLGKTIGGGIGFSIKKIFSTVICLAFLSEPAGAVGHPPAGEEDRNGGADGPPERQRQVGDKAEQREGHPEDLFLHGESVAQGADTRRGIPRAAGARRATAKAVALRRPGFRRQALRQRRHGAGTMYRAPAGSAEGARHFSLSLSLPADFCSSRKVCSSFEASRRRIHCS